MRHFINSLSIVVCAAAAFHLLAFCATQAATLPQQQQTQQLSPQLPSLAATNEMPPTKITVVATSPTSTATTATATATTTRTTPTSRNTFIDIAGNVVVAADTIAAAAADDLPSTAAGAASINVYLQQREPIQQPQQKLAALDKEVVERLIKQWAPIVWLAPEEKFMPLGVEEFLNHVHPMDRDRNFTPGVPFREYSTKSYLVTNADVEDLLDNEDSFLYGRNPNESRVPIYAVVTLCGNPRNSTSPLPPLPLIQKKKLSGLSPVSIQMQGAPEIIVPTLNAISSTRSPYIPVSIDPFEDHNDTLRRSSRLYPVFQRVKRDLTKSSTPMDGGLGYMSYPAYDLTTAESSNSVMGAPEGGGIGTFIANLADNVKFSGDELEDNTINEQRLDLTDSKQKVPGFQVTYWMFYPFSQGKTMCTLSLGPLGRIPFPAVYGYCLGRRKDIGSHIGDWEHMSLYFNGNAEPEAMYVSAHDAGAYYGYNHLTGAFEFKRQETRKGILQRPNFPKTVTTFNDHPVLFAAKGSHGLWTAPGKHRFVKVARLYDINGFGTPWNTWKAVDISYENLKSYGRSLVPDWLTFKGKWGNPKNKCHPFRRIGLNFCELTDGPTGIPLKESHFECGASYRS